MSPFEQKKKSIFYLLLLCWGTSEIPKERAFPSAPLSPPGVCVEESGKMVPSLLGNAFNKIKFRFMLKKK